MDAQNGLSETPEACRCAMTVKALPLTTCRARPLRSVCGAQHGFIPRMLVSARASFERLSLRLDET